MKSVKLSALTLLLTGFSASALALPNITLLATGGTIAGGGDSATKSNYTAGKLGVEALVDAVPALKTSPTCRGAGGEHRFAGHERSGMADVGEEDRRRLQQDRRLRHHPRHRYAGRDGLLPRSDGEVRQAGGAGRGDAPATALSADGPFNLYNAVVTAADPQSANRGVLVAMNDTVLDARDVTKTNTTAVQTFQSPNFGPLGYIHNGKIDYQRSPQRKHTRDTPFDVSKLNELPKVGIVTTMPTPPMRRPRR